MAENKRVVQVILEGVDRTVDAFLRATANARGLGATLKNLGLDAAKLRPEIEQMSRSLSLKTGIVDEKVLGSFNQLLQLTGDYGKSLANTGLVLDIAKARNLDLQKAGDLVARAISGDVRVLKDLGVTAKSTEGVLEQLNARFKGVAEAANTAPKGWTAAFGGLKTMLAGLGATLVAIGVGRFFQSSVAEAAEAERRYAGLGAALRNIGQDAAGLRPEIEATVNTLSTTTGIADDQILGALTGLIQLTGDYERSVASLPLVLDIAKGRNLDLATAADVVGKVMNGNERAARSLGIETRTGAEAIELLRQRYRGMAATEGQTFTGMLNRIREALSNVKQAIGDAIVGNTELRGSGNRVVEMFVSLEGWVRRNEGTISDMVTAAVEVGGALGSLAGFIGTVLVGAFEGAQKVIGTFVTGLRLIPAMGPVVRSAIIDMLVDVIETANAMLNRLGIHLADSMVAGIRRGADQAAAEARARRDAILGDWRAGMASFERGTPGAPAPAPATPGTGLWRHTPPPPPKTPEQLRQEELDREEQRRQAERDREKRADFRARALSGEMFNGQPQVVERTGPDRERVQAFEAERRRADLELQNARAAEADAVQSGLAADIVRAQQATKVAEARFANADAQLRAVRAGDNLLLGRDEVPIQPVPDLDMGPDPEKLTRYEAALLSLKITALDVATAFQANLKPAVSGALEAIVTQEASLGAAAAGAIRASLVGPLKVKQKAEFAHAAAKFAEGIWPPNPAAIASGFKHLAAAGAYQLAISAAGGGGSGGGGVSAGGGGGGSTLSGDRVRTDLGTRPERIINLRLGEGAYVNPRSPEMVDMLRDMLEAAGSQNVTINVS